MLTISWVTIFSQSLCLPFIIVWHWNNTYQNTTRTQLHFCIIYSIIRARCLVIHLHSSPTIKLTVGKFCLLFFVYRISAVTARFKFFKDFVSSSKTDWSASDMSLIFRFVISICFSLIFLVHLRDTAIQCNCTEI